MNASAHSIDTEQRKVRALQIIPTNHPLPPLSQVTPAGVTSLSSIAKATATQEAPQHRPTLSPPRNMMASVIDAHLKTESLTQKGSKLFDADVTYAMAQIDRLSAEKEEALENAAKQVQTRTTWSTFSLVAQYVASISLMTTGNWWLIGAGVVGVGNRVIQDTNLLPAATAWWTESVELQHKITQNIEMGTFFLQMGLGLVGGFSAWQTGAMTTAQINSAAIKSKLASTISGAAGVISVGSKLGASYYDKQVAHLQAQVKNKETQINLNQFRISDDATQMSKLIDAQQLENDEVRKAIQATQVSID